MVRISVVGAGTERASAERGTVVVVSKSRAAQAQAAMHAAATAHAVVTSAAKAFVDSGAAERWHADRVLVDQVQEWVGDSQERRIVHEARAATQVTFIDFDALGSWIGGLGTKPEFSIAGVQWTLSEETEQRLASSTRKLAIQSAMLKARDFAEASGLAEPRIVEIQEAGAAQADGVQEAWRGKAQLMRGSVSAAPEVELAAGDIEVTTSVTVHFDADLARYP